MKVILNKCFGGFNLSHKAYKLYAKKKNLTLIRYICTFYEEDGHTEMKYVKDDESSGILFKVYSTKDYGEETYNIDDKDIFTLDENMRVDATLIEVVEELGDKANTHISELHVVEVPDDLDYVIDDFDGYETLHQKVQEW